MWFRVVLGHQLINRQTFRHYTGDGPFWKNKQGGKNGQKMVVFKEIRFMASSHNPHKKWPQGEGAGGAQPKETSPTRSLCVGCARCLSVPLVLAPFKLKRHVSELRMVPSWDNATYTSHFLLICYPRYQPEISCISFLKRSEVQKGKAFSCFCRKLYVNSQRVTKGSTSTASASPLFVLQQPFAIGCSAMITV